MGLDVRVPVGLMFAIMGALLAGYGLFGDHTIRVAGHELGVRTHHIRADIAVLAYSTA